MRFTMKFPMQLPITTLFLGLLFGPLSLPVFAASSPDAQMEFAHSGLTAELFWETGPVLNPQESVLRLEFLHAASGAAADLAINPVVAFTMPMMNNHGTRPTVVEPAKDSQGKILPGIFLVSKIYFLMGDAWRATITITNADGAQETETWDFNVAGGMGHM